MLNFGSPLPRRARGWRAARRDKPSTVAGNGARRTLEQNAEGRPRSFALTAPAFRRQAASRPQREPASQPVSAAAQAAFS